MSCFGGSNGSINLSVSGGTPSSNSTRGLLISEVLANPAGTDSPFEFVELVATKTINFAVTPYTVIWNNNGAATTKGWVRGGAISYAFTITTGSVNAGDVVYVGGSSMVPTTNVIRAINTSTTAGDGGIGTANASGILGNGGANCDGVAVFAAAVTAIDSSTVPVDAIFYGTGAGTAVVAAGAQGYQLPISDMYTGGKLQTTSFLAPDPISGQTLVASGAYNVTTNTFTTARTWSNVAAFTNLSSSVAVSGLYTYSWSNSSSNEDLTGLTANTYSVTITDAAGCTVTASATITQPTALVATGSAANATCTQPIGQASVLVSGGTPGYTYSWAPVSSTNDTISGPAGIYTVTITDANNCTKVDSVTIGLTSTLQANAITTLPTCNGGSDGMITLNPSGGVGPFTYAWTPNVSTTNTAMNLSAGTYVVVVTDSGGCSGTTSVTITQPSAIVSTAAVTASSQCSCTGAATITPSGGTAPYSITWVQALSGFTVTGLCPGTYVYTITDGSGCSNSDTLTIGALPGSVSATAAIVNTTCFNTSNGSITVTPSGGTAPYTYVWSPNVSSSNTATGLAAGTYVVTTTDASNCSTVDSFIVTSPPSLAFSLGADTTICANATIQLCGPAGYTYVWCNNSTTQCIVLNTTVCCGLSITDSNGCTAIDSICITVDICNSTPELGASAPALFYPNPAQETITVQLTEGETLAQFELFDARGRRVIARTVRSQDLVDVSALEAGIYLVRINGTARRLVIE